MPAAAETSPEPSQSLEEPFPTVLDGIVAHVCVHHSAVWIVCTIHRSEWHAELYFGPCGPERSPMEYISVERSAIVRWFVVAMRDLSETEVSMARLSFHLQPESEK